VNRFACRNSLLFCVLCLLAGSTHATAEDVLPPPVAARGPAARILEPPACTAAPRLHAVRFDPRRAERSFAVFGVGAEQRPQLFRPGARIAGYELVRVEQGAVLLVAHGQSCSLRLRGTSAERELRSMPVTTVRAALRAHKTGAVLAPRLAAQ
jgi:hypothetical protein